MTENKKTEMAKILSKIDAIQFGNFKLTNGKISPYYIDLRIVPSFPDAYRDIIDYYTQQILSEIGAKNITRIAGIPIAGIPFATQIAYNLKKPFLYVPKNPKLHGRQRRVEGILISGDKVLLVDDLVTTGLSLKNAAEAIRAEGGIVTDAIAFLDREEGGAEKLAEAGIKLHALMHISEIVNTLYELGAVDEESLKTITKQIKKKQKT